MAKEVSLKVDGPFLATMVESFLNEKYLKDSVKVFTVLPEKDPSSENNTGNFIITYVKNEMKTA